MASSVQEGGGSGHEFLQNQNYPRSNDVKHVETLDCQSHSTPNQSNSSGISSRGCTPPLQLPSLSGSPVPANKSQHKSSSRLSKHESDPIIIPNELNTSLSDSLPSCPASSSNKPYSKLSHIPSNSSIVSNGSEKRKKKSWMRNALNPTYRSKCEDLNRNFPGLPPEETLIVDYSCALQKDILVHGRLYATTNFLCFYANIFRWETAVTIRWREVTAMTKEKTALVIPNAVQICTNSEKLFFTSFAARDKTHMMLFRLWQNALLDSPATQTEIWSWVQSVYGVHTNRYNDYNGDESNDGGSSYDGLDITGSGPSLPRHRLYSNIEEEEEGKLAGNLGTFTHDRPDEVLVSVLPGNDQSDLSDGSRRSHSHPPRSLTSPAIVSTDILTYEVWRQSKEAREIVSKNFAINIDELFTLLFTNSKFFYDFQAERKTFDIVQCPWKHSDKSEDKFREVSYTLNLNHSIGPKTSRATEVQTMRSNSVPGHIYNVDVETTNADIPYADTFFVATHFCVVKVNDEESLLTVLCDIKYKKAPWGLVKSFIEKNCWAGIEEHYEALTTGLEKEIENRIAEETGKEIIGNKKKTRRQRNQRRASASSESVLGAPVSQVFSQVSQVFSQPKVTQPTPKSSLKHDQTLVLILLSMLGLLCLLNLFLIYKIWGLESKMAMKSETFSSFHDKGPREPSSSSDWLDVLHKQEVLHNQDLAGWRAAVESATKLLQQTENSMIRLAQGFNQESNRRLLQNLLKYEESTYGKMFKEDTAQKEL